MLKLCCTKFCRDLRRDIHVPDGQENHVRERLEVTESAGAIFDNLDDSVESLGHRVCQPCFDERDDVSLMATQRERELFHGLQPASQRGGNPSMEKRVCCPIGCRNIPRRLRTRL